MKEGSHLFVISGKLPNVRQFVMGGFEVAKKIDAQEAYRRFPDQHLRLREDTPTLIKIGLAFTRIVAICAQVVERTFATSL